jgi:hypothetical protein
MRPSRSSTARGDGGARPEIHHRVKNNLQTVASLLRLQARAEGVDPRKALDDSVNRVLAIAAVHEVLTEQREDDVDAGELLDRLRGMLVQGLAPGKRVVASLDSISAGGERATALALVFSDCPAAGHGGTSVTVSCAGMPRWCYRSPTTVRVTGRRPGAFDRPRALRDELGGTLALGNRRWTTR